MEHKRAAADLHELGPDAVVAPEDVVRVPALLHSEQTLVALLGAPLLNLPRQVNEVL